MGLKQRVERRLSESVVTVMRRHVDNGKTISFVAEYMDVSYTTAWSWAKQHEIKFKSANPFGKWTIK